MPGLVRGAVSLGTLPFSLSTKFTEAHSAQVNINEYHDGSSQRQSLVTVGRRSWKLAKRLTATQLAALQDFYDTVKSGAFYFYSPFETLPPFSHSPSGTSGRYLVRFANDWEQTNGISRIDTGLDLIELASAQDIADSSTTTSSAVPTSATLFLTSEHIPSPDFTPNFGAGASLDTVGLIFPNPSWFHSTASWSKRTDSISIDPNSIGSMFLLLMLEHESSTGSGPISPDQLLIYDCHVVLTYGDGSTVTYRPTSNAVDASQGGATGSVTNPANAYDGDDTTYALLSCTEYVTFFNGIFLNLNSFRPV